MAVTSITTNLDGTHRELVNLSKMRMYEANPEIRALLRGIGHALALPRIDGNIDLYGTNAWGN